jgi:hypothetical protein
MRVTRDDNPLMQLIWESVGGEGTNPFCPQPSIGQESDAIAVTQDIYDKFLKEFEGVTERECDMEGKRPAFADLDEERVSPAFIDRKWAVIVHCHS